MIRKQSHDGSLATVRAICFRVHHGCIILHTMFYNAVSFAHFQKLLAFPGSLKRKTSSYHSIQSNELPFRNMLTGKTGFKKIDTDRLFMYNNHKIVLNKFYLTFIAVRQENPTKFHTCTKRLEK